MNRGATSTKDDGIGVKDVIWRDGKDDDRNAGESNSKMRCKAASVKPNKGGGFNLLCVEILISLFIERRVSKKSPILEFIYREVRVLCNVDL